MGLLKRIKKKPYGRLLNEFLVSLGILFLALGADMAILHSATDSSTDAMLMSRALKIARDGLEEVLAQPELLKQEQIEEKFDAGDGHQFDDSFVRKIWFTETDVGPKLVQVTVKVEWAEGHRHIYLERYVRSR